MENKQLPRPATSTDLYLAAILAELRAMNADHLAELQGIGQALQAGTAVTNVLTSELVDIREPAPAAGTELPDDFPGRDALVTAGFSTLESVPADGDALVKIEGIGKVTAGKILAALV